MIRRLKRAAKRRSRYRDVPQIALYHFSEKPVTVVESTAYALLESGPIAFTSGGGILTWSALKSVRRR